MSVRDGRRKTPSEQELMREQGVQHLRQIQYDIYKSPATIACFDENGHGYHDDDDLYCFPAHFSLTPTQEARQVEENGNDFIYQEDDLECDDDYAQQDELRARGDCQPDGPGGNEGQALARFWRPNRLY